MSPIDVSILAGTALVSILHGLLPNHWLPFVLIGRAQSWTLGRTLWILSMAAAAHAAVSGFLALITLLFGVAIEPLLEGFGHFLPGGILLAVGAGYIGLDLLHRNHPHHHEIHSATATGLSDRTAVVTLVLSLALSPCEATVPIFVSAAPSGNAIFIALLVVTFGVSSLTVMAVLAALAFHGTRRLDFGRFARRERLVIGASLAFIGVVVLGLSLLGWHADSPVLKP